MTNPSPRPQRQHSSRETTPGPVFRVGLPQFTEEVVRDGRRYLYWYLGADDERVAPFAGWQERSYEHHDNVGRIEMPLDARSASSALAGAEAWMGEKDQILSAMSGYARHIFDRFGAVDTNLQLDSVAVTRGNEAIFMVPPHNLVQVSEAEAREWLETLHEDIEVVLSSDPRNSELLSGFDQSTDFLREAN